jgi:hypothetical protein
VQPFLDFLVNGSSSLVTWATKRKEKANWAQTLPDFRKTGLWGGKDDGHSMFWLSSWLNGLAPAAMFPELYKHSKSHRAGRADK